MSLRDNGRGTKFAAMIQMAIATKRSRNADRIGIKRCECRYRPDSYCNPKTQNRRENRDGLFALPWGGRKRGNEVFRALAGRFVHERTV